MHTKFTRKRPRSIASQTHVGVHEVIVNTDGSLKITGELGKVSIMGKWARAELSAMNWSESISGEEFKDFIVQSEGRGRPTTKPVHEWAEVDLIAHLEENPAKRQTRIEKRIEQARIEGNEPTSAWRHIW